MALERTHLDRKTFLTCLFDIQSSTNVQTLSILINGYKDKFSNCGLYIGVTVSPLFCYETISTYEDKISQFYI